jgi:ABC-type multidrug transport system fused ATPase/permease subunit
MKMHHKTGVGIMVIGGILMIASYTGGTIKAFEFIYNLIVNQWPQSQQIASIILNIFQWIADLGGIAIIVGAILILLGVMRIGKFIAWIGLAFGTFALIVWIVSWINELTGIITDPTIDTYLDTLYSQFNYGSSLSFIGVVIAIIGRIFVRRVKKEKIITEEPIIEATYNVDDENIQADSDTKFCPNCGTKLPAYANFCNNCGETFN